MDKTLIAYKTEEGWYYEIIESDCAKTEDDVRKIMKKYNLKQVKELSTDDKIYARL